MMASLHRKAIVCSIVLLTSIAGAAPARSYYSALSNSEYKALRELAYPQSERAMLSRFGEPIWRTGDYDYYPVGSNAIARVAYVGRRAQSVEFIVEGEK